MTMQGARSGLAGFLAMAFAVVGLTGLLTATIAPLPFQRALQRDAVLDEVLVLARAGNAAGLEALRPRLGDSAAAVLAAGGLPAGDGMEARVAAERIAQRARRVAEAEATGRRLKALMVVVTLVAGGFGVAMMLASRRVAPEETVR